MLGDIKLVTEACDNFTRASQDAVENSIGLRACGIECSKANIDMAMKSIRALSCGNWYWRGGKGRPARWRGGREREVAEAPMLSRRHDYQVNGVGGRRPAHRRAGDGNHRGWREISIMCRACVMRACRRQACARPRRRVMAWRRGRLMCIGGICDLARKRRRRAS